MDLEPTDCLEVAGLAMLSPGFARFTEPVWFGSAVVPTKRGGFTGLTLSASARGDYYTVCHSHPIWLECCLAGRTRSWHVISGRPTYSLRSFSASPSAGCFTRPVPMSEISVK